MREGINYVLDGLKAKIMEGQRTPGRSATSSTGSGEDPAALKKALLISVGELDGVCKRRDEEFERFAVDTLGG